MGYRGQKEYKGYNKESMGEFVEFVKTGARIVNAGWDQYTKKQERQLANHFAKICIDIAENDYKTAKYHSKEFSKLKDSYEK